MAKMNKIMPPRNTTIRGQDHLLAYITPEEAQMLMANGGSGNAGPMGIPAFDRGGGGPGGSAGSSGAGGSGSSGAGAGDNDDGGMGEGQDNTGIADAAGYGGGSPSGGGGGASQDVRDRATAKDYGTPNPSAQDIEAARGFDFGSEASKAMEQSFASGFNQMGAGLGYNVSGLELDRAFGQLDDRMAKAQNLPGLLGIMANFNLSNIRSGLQKGHMPAFDKAGQIQGVFGPDPFGFGGLVYSGNPIEGNEATGYSAPTAGGDGYDPRPEVAPVNPETGQCDEGYMFDEDMQACRLDTGFASGGQPDGFAPESGAYARMGLLDEAPTGLPEFQQRYGAGFGTPSEFADANLAFRKRGAYRPEYFDQPYPTTGYTLLS